MAQDLHRPYSRPDHGGYSVVAEFIPVSQSEYLAAFIFHAVKSLVEGCEVSFAFFGFGDGVREVGEGAGLYFAVFIDTQLGEVSVDFFAFAPPEPVKPPASPDGINEGFDFHMGLEVGLAAVFTEHCDDLLKCVTGIRLCAIVAAHKELDAAIMIFIEALESNILIQKVLVVAQGCPKGCVVGKFIAGAVHRVNLWKGAGISHKYKPPAELS